MKKIIWEYKFSRVRKVDEKEDNHLKKLAEKNGTTIIEERASVDSKSTDK